MFGGGRKCSGSACRPWFRNAPGSRRPTGIYRRHRPFRFGHVDGSVPALGRIGECPRNRQSDLCGRCAVGADCPEDNIGIVHVAVSPTEQCAFEQAVARGRQVPAEMAAAPGEAKRCEIFAARISRPCVTILGSQRLIPGCHAQRRAHFHFRRAGSGDLSLGGLKRYPAPFMRSSIPLSSPRCQSVGSVSV